MALTHLILAAALINSPLVMNPPLEHDVAVRTALLSGGVPMVLTLSVVGMPFAPFGFGLGHFINGDWQRGVTWMGRGHGAFAGGFVGGYTLWGVTHLNSPQDPFSEIVCGWLGASICLTGASVWAAVDAFQPSAR